MTFHISDQVASMLKSDGWTYSGGTYTKTLRGFSEAGTFSDGTRNVRLRLSPGGRWLERVDGWGSVMKDVDLRNFPGAPEKAITAVLAH